MASRMANLLRAYWAAMQMRVGCQRFQCPLLAISRHSERCARESALPPKADVKGCAVRCLLLTHSGHCAPNNSKGQRLTKSPAFRGGSGASQSIRIASGPGGLCLDGEKNDRMAFQARADHQNHAIGWLPRGYSSLGGGTDVRFPRIWGLSGTCRISGLRCQFAKLTALNLRSNIIHGLSLVRC